MGNASFAHLQDGAGKIQIYVRRDDVGEEAYAAFKDFALGDVLGVTGRVFRTKAGEVSVHATGVTLLTKCLHPLPEKFHGLRDTDLRYRQRYLDLIMNPEVKDTFVKRSGSSRHPGFSDARATGVGYAGRATWRSARRAPFVTHHNALDIDMFLRIETELHLKP
jgi:lysyl-tRNA synthetase class 2